ncbi:MAG: hypothetical protein F6K41_00315 [Symploca sp. SIO3E6]|nr:hypothetical protein [Caldora sp. SIO3E6]
MSRLKLTPIAYNPSPNHPRRRARKKLLSSYKEKPKGKKIYIPNSQFPIPNSQFSILNSQFPIPNSQFPIPNSQFPIPYHLTNVPLPQSSPRLYRTSQVSC